MVLVDFTIDEREDCLQALRRMDANRKGFLIVIDGLGKALGALTDGDVRRAAIATSGNLSHIHVNDACT